MRVLLLICWTTYLILLSSSSNTHAFDHTHQHYAEALNMYVSDQGVNYAELKSDTTSLESYLNEIAKLDKTYFESWTSDSQLALLLNLYNASTLNLVVNHYPVKSIRKIGGFFGNPWKMKVVRIWGETHSLDWLEHEIIRLRFPDPRVHFALVCAAKSCPPLRREPFFGNRLHEQLEDQAKIFMAQSSKNRVDADNQILYLSPIFKWYRDDFVDESTTLVDYASRFLTSSDETELALGGYEIKFTEYNWSLNDVSKLK